MNSFCLGPMNTNKFSDTARWQKLFFGLLLLSASELSEVHDAFADAVISNTPTSDFAVKFADYVLENQIDVDSKFSPTLWAQAPDVSGAIPHTSNGAAAYHSRLDAEFYVKHPNYTLSRLFFSRRCVRLLVLNRCVFIDFFHAFLCTFSCVFVINRNAFLWSVNALSQNCHSKILHSIKQPK